jgi:hypothetical protein
MGKFKYMKQLILQHTFKKIKDYYSVKSNNSDSHCSALRFLCKENVNVFNFGFEFST